MDQTLIDLLTDRIRLAKNDPTYMPTQEELDAEYVVYQEEQAQIRYDELVDHYNSIKRTTDADLTGEETEDELVSMIEVIERELAVEAYTDLTLLHIEKPELTTEMDSKAINSLIESLKAQDAAETERLRREDLQARYDAIAKDAFASMINIGIDPNIVSNQKYFRNVTLVGDCPRNPFDADYAESIMQQIEAEAVNVKAAREAREKQAELDKAAQIIMDRANNGMKYIVAYNMDQIALGNLDSAGLDNLETLFADVLTKIQAVRPDKAADIVETLDLTGTVYTETQRTELINILRGL